MAETEPIGTHAAHLQDVTYTDHPQHQPIFHAPITTAGSLVEGALTAMRQRGASDEAMQDMKALGDKWGAHPLNENHEVRFLAELVTLLIIGQSK